MRAFVRQCHVLRAPLLLLLVLGMVLGPVLAAVGELHGMEHAAAAGDAPAGHVHADDAGHHGHHGDEVDPDHATGQHGLMHQAGSVPVALPVAALDIAVPPTHAPRLPGLPRCDLPGDVPDLPFRPPIA